MIAQGGREEWEQWSKSFCWSIQSTKGFKISGYRKGWKVFVGDEVSLCRYNFNALHLASDDWFPFRRAQANSKFFSAAAASTEKAFKVNLIAVGWTELSSMIVKYTGPERKSVWMEKGKIFHPHQQECARVENREAKGWKSGERRWNLKLYLIRKELLSYFTLVAPLNWIWIFWTIFLAFMFCWMRIDEKLCSSCSSPSMSFHFGYQL